MIGCKEAVRHLWEYLDETVGDADREALEEHLRRCRRCCAELEFAEEMRRFLSESSREEIPPDVMARLDETLEGLGER